MATRTLAPLTTGLAAHTRAATVDSAHGAVDGRDRNSARYSCHTLQRCVLSLWTLGSDANRRGVRRPVISARCGSAAGVPVIRTTCRGTLAPHGNCRGMILVRTARWLAALTLVLLAVGASWMPRQSVNGEGGDVVAAPAQTIVHIKDWHLVSRARFVTDLRESLGAISKAELEQAYEDHLQAVEAVQHDQLAILRQLIAEHGLEVVYYEGFTRELMPAFELQVRRARESSEALTTIQADLRQVQLEIEQVERAGGMAEDYQRELQGALEDGLLEHRLDMLRIGAAGQLYLAGEIKQVLPLDERATYEASEPVGPDGRIVLDAVRIEAREDAQAAILSRGGAFVVAILGGAHDLSDNLKRQHKEGVELRVLEPNAYRRIAIETPVNE